MFVPSEIRQTTLAFRDGSILGNSSGCPARCAADSESCHGVFETPHSDCDLCRRSSRVTHWPLSHTGVSQALRSIALRVAIIGGTAFSYLLVLLKRVQTV